MIVDRRYQLCGYHHDPVPVGDDQVAGTTQDPVNDDRYLVRRDLQAYFARIAPESDDYEHDDEGPDDMPAHLRTALTGVSLSIPVIGGEPALGTWQGLYLFEHRARPHRREVALHLIGEPA